MAVSIEKFTTLVNTYPDVEEHPHFEKRAFKIKKKRIFCTLETPRKRICVKLSVLDQSVYVQIDPSIIYAVPNKWGKQGWTFVELSRVTPTLLKEVLSAAYGELS